MATSSLLNFTVPLSDLGNPVSGQGMIFPKLKLRFRVLFVGFGNQVSTLELTKQVIDFKRPSVKFAGQKIEVYNSTINYAGKPEWDETTLTFRDDMQGMVSALVAQQVQRQFDFYNQASASSASDYKFEMVVQQLDGGNGTSEPIILEQWDMAGCTIMSVDYDSNTYSNTGEALTVKLNVKFDNAIQTPSGVGAVVVPRTNGTSAI